MKITIFLLFLAFSAVSAVRVVNQNTENTLACCAGSTSDATYFTNNQQCCFGIVVGVGTTDTFDCCGTDTLSNGRSCCGRSDGTARSTDRPYDPATQICCNGTVLSQSATNPQQCCGTSLYNPSTDLCCGDNTVFRNSVAGGSVCCGNNQIYNPTTDTCCLSINGNGNANRGALSGSNAANPKDQCCGTTAYSSNTQFCCGTTISTIPTGFSASDMSCCGTTAYVTSQRKCCGNTLSTPATGTTVSDYDCCGTRSFLTSTSQCCSVITTTQISTNVIANTQTCCGINGYDPNTQLCCAGNIRSSSTGQLSCCGTGTFNPTTQQCCGDKPQASTLSCCGNLGYDPSRQTCCAKADGTPVVGNDVAKTSCCTDGTSFNPNSQSCPCGRVIELSTDLSILDNTLPACCDSRQYDQNTDFCCQPSRAVNSTLTLVKPSVFFTGLPGIVGFSCCFNDTSKAYNPGWQTCCDYKKKKDTKTKVVCGTSCCQASRDDKPKGYFAAYQYCCSGVTRDFTNDAGLNPGNFACCDSGLFDTDFRACCGGRLVYDPITQICCGGF